MDFICNELNKATSTDECFDCPRKMKCDLYASMLDEAAELEAERRRSLAEEDDLK